MDYTTAQQINIHGSSTTTSDDEWNNTLSSVNEKKRLKLIGKITGMDMDHIYETPKKYRFDE